MSGADLRVGVDVGGTFTDVLVETPEGRFLGSFKLPSTPAEPAGAVQHALAIVRERWAGAGQTLLVCHGTTVGTNALIEKKGARTVLVTTKGFRDVLALRRQARPALFALAQQIAPPLVDAELRLEINERIGPDGTVLKPVDPDEIERLIDRMRSTQCEAVAVCLLHAYANAAHERVIKDALQKALPSLFVTISSEISPEFREYERTSTTVVNSYIGPAVRNYINELDKNAVAVGMGALAITKSNGGLTSPSLAARYPAHLIESGPAAGVVAAATLARTLALPRALAFDVGGTTAKIAVIQDGHPQMTREFHADRFVDGHDQGGYPVRSPVIDLIEIGAGGGSIAWLDRAGVIRIGPRSAGAAPGPACYARGGELPTVTDAHAAVERLVEPLFKAANMAFDPDRARRAIAEHIATPRGWSVAKAAHAILELASAKMAELVRLATVRRGLDPREFVLIAYGGAGPLHAAEIASEVGIKTVIVPPSPGMFSAGGTLRAEIRHDLVQTVLQPLCHIAEATLTRAFEALTQKASRLMATEHDVATRRVSREYMVEARFAGQLFELEVPVAATARLITAIETGFRQAHQRTFGYDLPDAEIELVNLKLTARAEPTSVSLGVGEWGHDLVNLPDHRTVGPDGSSISEPIRSRWGLPVGSPVTGPLLISDDGATVRVLRNQYVTLEPSGILRIEALP